jgi:acetyl-CoA acetyltransferase
VLASAHDTDADLATTNANGGAIAIGHPLRAHKCQASDGARR